MNQFTDTVPVKRPQEITPDDGHNIIRGSWPASAHRTHDYSVHTAECDQCEDHDLHMPGARTTLPGSVSLLLIAVGAALASLPLRVWLVGAGACVAAIIVAVLP